MRCSHVFDVNAVAVMCMAKLVKGKWHFKCPMCNDPWDYLVVQHILSTVLPHRRLGEMAGRISELFIQQNAEFRECLRCGCVCERDPDNSAAAACGRINADKVVCVVCSLAAGRTVEFCWRCLQTWKSVGSTASCGNDQCCTNTSSRENLAAFGVKKKAGTVKQSPAIRACPQCGVLVQTEGDGYRHVTCLACSHEFCFVCLKGKDGRGEWQCWECYGPCRPAPFQPGMHPTGKTVVYCRPD